MRTHRSQICFEADFPVIPLKSQSFEGSAIGASEATGEQKVWIEAQILIECLVLFWRNLSASTVPTICRRAKCT
jgi:hypothetical protein